MWNSSLYGLAFIYRLNQSKVYIWRILCTFAYVRVWICYDIAITESPASIIVYLSLLVSNDNANDSVVGKSLGIVRGKIRFYKLIGFSAKPQNATNRNQRNNRKQGKCENVVFLNFCFCIVSRQDRILVSVLIFRWLWNNKIDLRINNLLLLFFGMVVKPILALSDTSASFRSNPIVGCFFECKIRDGMCGRCDRVVKNRLRAFCC